MKKFTRRKVLKTLGAAAALPIAAPYLNLAHAQGATIPIGVALPMTGNAGAYGPDMAEAAKRTVAKINNDGGILGGRKLELVIEDSESSASVAANLSQKFINVHKCPALVGYWGTPEGMSSRPIAIQNKTVLMVDNGENRNLTLGARNLDGVTLMASREVSVYELLKHEKVLLSQAAAAKLSEALSL